MTKSDDVPRKWTRVTPRKKAVIFYGAEKVVLSAGVYKAVENEIFIVILGTQWIFCWTMLFATSYKPEGGRCLPFSEITLPYQISGEMKFVCLRMVVAVNQTHTNLFFTSPSLEGPSDGSLTGSNTQAGDVCCNAAILCISAPHVRGNSCRERHCKVPLQHQLDYLIPP